jgi:hypothetical protein
VREAGAVPAGREERRMAKISVFLRIDDGGMGEGWKDDTAAAFALAEHVEMRWENDLEPLRAAGHDVTVHVEVLKCTIGGACGPYVYALDDDDVEDDRLAVEADGMLTNLVYVAIEWENTSAATKLRAESQAG